MKTRSHPLLAVGQPPAQLVVVDAPETDLAFGERSELRDRPAVEVRFRLAGDRLHAGHQMGDELVRRPTGARRHGVRGHFGERIEEDIGLTPGCDPADFRFCVRKNDAYGRTS